MEAEYASIITTIGKSKSFCSASRLQRSHRRGDGFDHAGVLRASGVFK